MLKEKNKKENYCSEILYELADYYYNKSSSYYTKDEKTLKYKNYKKEAHILCENVIEKYPKSEAADKCLSLKYRIETHSLSFNVEDVIIPKKPFVCMLDYQSISNIYIKVSSIDRAVYENLINKGYNHETLYNKIMTNSTQVYSTTKKLPEGDDFNPHSTELILSQLSIGFYVIIIANNEDFTYLENMTTYKVQQVSNISYIRQEETNGSLSYYVINRETSEPMPNTEIKAYYDKYNSVSKEWEHNIQSDYKSDKNGYFKIQSIENNNWRNLALHFTKDDDFYTTSNYSSYKYNFKIFTKNRITFFTDRAIYRPGQTVYFKGLVLKPKDENWEIMPEFSTTVTFYDVNNQIISKTDVKSNEFGTFSGSFDIPNGLLNGEMKLKTEYGDKYIKVEEYKRPTFEIEMLPFDGNYILNDSITLKGKALNYTGAKVSDAKVQYRIKRKPKWFGWRYYNYSTSTVEIGNGTVTTDQNGEFKIKFKAIPNLSIAKNEYTAFDYTIIADVTDLNGETQSTSKNITVGYRALKVDISFPEKICKESPPNNKWEANITTQNLNYQFIPAKGEIEIFKLKENKTPLRSRLWNKPEYELYTKAEWYKQFPGNVYKDENEFENYEVEKTVYSESFDTEKEKVLNTKFMKKWKSGVYMAKITSTDKFGNPVSYNRFFVLFSEKDKTTPYKTCDWFVPIKTTCEPGENAKLIIGSSLKDVKILYEISRNKKSLKKEWLKIDNSQQIIEIPITEEYRGNIAVTFTFVKNNRIYSHSQIITVPYSNKNLDIEFSTFRDELYPGQEEEWTLTIKGAKGDKVLAEMVATLYDASLDEFVVNNWYTNFYKSFYNTITWSGNSFSYKGSRSLTKLYNKYYSPTYKNYNSFNWFGFSYYTYSYFFGNEDARLFGSLIFYNGSDNPIEISAERIVPYSSEIFIAASDTTLSPMVLHNVSESNLGEGLLLTQTEQKFDNVQIRKNFNETAFFYPHLLTNEKGEVVISFTMPESLTKWKFMGFAHTKDLEYGFINNEVITKKDLMVMPNAPRFFREGDKMKFPVKISNLSENELSGEIKLEFIDAITMKPIDNIIIGTDKAQKTFTVKAKGNTKIVWELEIPEGISLVTYKVVATTDEFSDGEQRPVPVMTNRMLVTESMPLSIRGKKTKKFKFDKLINSGSSTTIKHHRLTLEFTSNPAWYAVQALPYLIEYPYECSEQTFSRYYANTLASFIANSNPKIKAVFEAWKNIPKSEALLSNLEKNQELKAVLLEETPWVLNSQDETERKRRIGLLFDLNLMANEQTRALKKLQNEQLHSGAWSWFAGMPESRYITQHIVSGMGHLKNLGVIDLEKDYEIKQMLNKAIEYLDYKLVGDYKRLKDNYTEEEMKENHLSQIAIHYFYGRSYFLDNQILAISKEAFDYYKGQMQKYWLTRSKYEQGMISLSLHRYKDEKTPNMIINSLREHSTTDKELGMYWKDNVAGYYWYQAPIETQALMIEAFDEVADDQKSVDDMKVWLLKNKQINDWQTTKATAEAVYALLLQGTDMLADDQLCEVQVGNQLINPTTMDEVSVEAGTGYFKVAWFGSEIKPEMGNVTVTKKTKGVAWGALYWQYFEDLDKITTHETPLKLEKKLYKEVITDRGAVLEPISDDSKLEIGDKIIVRIELRVDREMDYVHMKDMRASGFEPINVISRYKWQDGLGYYESTKDASTNFFISHLPKGTFVFEYPLRVTHSGNFSNGITTIQCMYAPEFTSHSEGIRVEIE